MKDVVGAGSFPRATGFDQHVVVDSSEIREILLQIIAELIGKGAWLNPGFRVVYAASEFSLECAPSPLVNESLLKVPNSCLLPLHQFELAYEDGSIQLVKSWRRVTRTRQRLMELTLALYNASDKVERFARTSPEIILGSDHPMTKILASGDGLADSTASRRTTTADQAARKLEQFLGSRTYGTRFGRLRSVLIPVLDLMNHHPMGSGFKERREDKFISVEVSHPVQEKDECFVNYGNNKDTLDFFRYYHFVPMTLPYLLSIPVVLSPTSGSFIHINRGYREHQQAESHFIKKLPPRLHLNNNIVSCENIRISEQNTSDNMSVGIDFMVKMLGKSMGFPVTEDLIRETKFNLLEANRNYYTGLIKLANAEAVTIRNQALLENVVLMSEHQLALLNNYAINRSLHS